MKIKTSAIAVALAVAAVLSTSCGQQETKLEPVDYVNTNIGFVSHMLVPVYPTVSLPHSMLRVYPCRREYTTELVSGLPLWVTNHRGGAQLTIGFPGKRLDFDNEKVTPYSYETELASSTIHSIFSTSHQSAVYNLTFREEGPAVISFNAGRGEMSAEGNIVKGWTPLDNETKAYVYAELETAPSKIENPRQGRVHLTFDTKTLRIRYGVSLISVEQAARNLAREINGYDVAPLIAEGRKIWNEALSRLEVNGGNDDDLTIFYTSYYRTLERPVNISEDGRYWSGEDNRVHEDGGVPYFTDDWLWDTYHSAHPLRTIVDRKMEESVLASYLRMSDENAHGWLPCFPSVSGAGRGMNSCHTIVSLADAVAKGLNVDIQKAEKAAVASLKGRTLCPWNGKETGQLDKFYWEHGYFPALRDGEKETDPNVHSFENRQPIPVTTGASLDCWATSRLAKVAGNLEDEEYFYRQSFNYRNLFNPETGFFHPKDKDGKFIEPFDYDFPGGMGAREYYDENNGWVYRWDVQHNIYDLVSLMGGDEKFVEALDSMFAKPLGYSKYEFWAKLPDHSGIVGQFSMGNEPSLHVPYLYDYAGAPWKTQKRVRQMLRTWFRNDLMGIPGDEDGGGMTSFVVFSYLGFFPVSPGTTEYAIGSPMFESAKIHLENGLTFEVKANGVSDENKYIQSATLNGEPWNDPFISQDDIMAGGVLEFEMGPLPNKEWGVKSSISYDSYTGLGMAGYQGWFSGPQSYMNNDRAWVEMLPDVTEYIKTYEAPAKLPDGKPVQVFSAEDYSTVDVHFRWMKQYGLDGVFMQRFLSQIYDPASYRHSQIVFANAISCAERYDRAICMMYDLSGGRQGEMVQPILDDIDDLNAKYDLFNHANHPAYLWHNGKPLIVIWGVGFPDRPEYYMDEIQPLIDGIKSRGYSLMLGVPTYWREQGDDTLKDPRLHDFIKQADIVMPWFVGRFDNNNFEAFSKIVPEDLKWCEENHIDYAPNCWPGFGWSWNIKEGGEDDHVFRQGGKFYQDQIDSYIKAGVKSIYFAMFDEINEGTALFKIARDIPAPKPGFHFTPLEDGVPNDRYLTIAGNACRELKKYK